LGIIKIIWISAHRVYCLIGGKREVEAGVFFHDKTPDGTPLSCICPVVKEEGDRKAKLICTKDEVLKGKIHIK
jgi:hypothetical protein